MSAIPCDFLQADVTIRDRRHLLFCTPEQRTLLQNASVWYLDGTFDVVRYPFVQLYGVHAFLTQDGGAKQVPLAFVMMSGKSKHDYKAVLKELRRSGGSPVAVVLDFEAAVWKAVRAVFPTASLRGCNFHWGQAVLRKMQALGLQSAYHEDHGTRRFCRKLLALPFLPHEHIMPTFQSLRAQVVDNAPLEGLVNYIYNTWLHNSQWTVQELSVYKRAVRTNNDVEGYHRRLQHRAQLGNLQFYLLLRLLHQEAQLVPLHAQLLTQHALKRVQRSRTRKVQAKIFGLWSDYRHGRLQVAQLLRAIGRIYAPSAFAK